MISCSKISLSYGQRLVIKDFSANFKEGSITAILGSNGSGKSTLLEALAGGLSPLSGEINLKGKPVNQYSVKELSHLRSMAVQSHQYWMAYTTAEILHLGYDDVSLERYKYLVVKLGLDSILNQTVTTLSGGQLQRIEIARALMRETPLILLDEPFASQDLASVVKITELLVAEKSFGRTIILVAHTRLDELSWCDQIIELETR